MFKPLVVSKTSVKVITAPKPKYKPVTIDFNPGSYSITITYVASDYFTSGYIV